VTAPRAAPGLGADLSRRLALLTVVGLGLVCAAVYAVIALTLAQRQDDTLDQKQAAITQLLGERAHGHSPAELEHLLGDMLAGHSDMSLQVTGAGGRPIFDRAPAQAGPAKQRHFDVPLAAGGVAQVRLTLDQHSDDELKQRLAWALACTAIAGALVVSAGAYWLVRRGLVPLHRLVEQTRGVTAHDLARRLDGSGQPMELQPLIAQFNALLGRLDGAYRQMEAFNADVAHELNTPLATLISSCELALRRSRSAEELREVLGSNLEELHRMAGIIGDMLFLSHADSGSDARRERVDSLARLAGEVIDFHEAALQEAGLQAAVVGETAAQVDARLLRRAISNLLGNATRYGRAGSTVTVSIRRVDGSGVEVAVENQGQDIAPEHLPRLFDRFYRADPARADAGRNHGLGLAIVAAIARMHGGQASAASSGGTTRIGLLLRDA
jgi:two-component system, OmpR family, heavy metal sensor histidine kinase CusS